MTGRSSTLGTIGTTAQHTQQRAHAALCVQRCLGASTRPAALELRFTSTWMLADLCFRALQLLPALSLLTSLTLPLSPHFGTRVDSIFPLTLLEGVPSQAQNQSRSRFSSTPLWACAPLSSSAVRSRRLHLELPYNSSLVIHSLQRPCCCARHGFCDRLSNFHLLLACPPLLPRLLCRAERCRARCCQRGGESGVLQSQPRRRSGGGVRWRCSGTARRVRRVTALEQEQTDGGEAETGACGGQERRACGRRRGAGNEREAGRAADARR